jgi:4'-phosphopantetheinyl transferase
MPAAFEIAMPQRQPGAQGSVFVGLFELKHWRPWIADAYALLDAAECQRVARRRTQAQRDELALAYALHRLFLAGFLHCSAGRVPIGRDQAGCPRLSGLALATSLSHADGCVALAVSSRGPVGVDIEPTTRAQVLPEIAERICHPDDAAAIAELEGDARTEALLALWVRKEALLKAAGIGLSREMASFAAPDDALLALPAGGVSRVHLLDAGPKWAAAVAAAPDAGVEYGWLFPHVAVEARQC